MQPVVAAAAQERGTGGTTGHWRGKQRWIDGDVDHVASAVPGTPTTYTITVTSAGPSTVSSVILTDVVPPALLNPVFGAESSGVYDPVTGIWSGLSLATGQSVSLTLTGDIDPAATGTLTNTAHVAPPAGVTDPNGANNNASDTDSLTPQSDLSVTKTDGVDVTSAVPGGSITYTIVVSNAGPSAVVGATVSDPLPAGASAGSWTATTSSGGGTVTGPSSGTGALLTTVDLPVGASVTFTFEVQISPSATGVLTNTATVTAPPGVTDPDPGDNTATDTDALTPQADLSITKSDDRTSVVPGTTTTYTITVRNAGLSAVTGASVSDPLPAGVIAAGWTTTTSSGGGSVTGPASGVGPLATTVDLPVGASVTFTFTVLIDPAATGSLVNTATVSPPTGATDPDPNNNSRSDINTLTPQADLFITKTDGSAIAVPGTNVTYTIKVTNNGVSSVTGATVSDVLPAGTSFVSATNGTIYDPVANTVRFTTGALAPNGTTSFQLTLAIRRTLTGTLNNTATVTLPAGVTDPNPGNNSSTDTDTLVPPADLVATKTVDRPRAFVGGNVTFTVTIKNLGPGVANNVVMQDLLPSGLTFISATPSRGRFDPTTRKWTIGTLASGASAVLKIVVRVRLPVRNTNVAIVSTTAFDTNLANNIAAAVVEGLSLMNMSKRKLLASQR